MFKKILIIMFCFILFGCKNSIIPSSDLLENINFEDKGIISSDLGEKCILLKTKNNNDTNVTLFSTVTLFDDKSNEVSNEFGMVNLYPGQETYYIVEISTANKYDHYKIVNNVAENVYENYEKTYSDISLINENYKDNEIIRFKVENNSKKTVTTTVLGIFYKDNNIVAASTGYCTDIEPKKSCQDAIYIPIKDIDSYKAIDYDKVDLSLMTVNYSNEK